MQEATPIALASAVSTAMRTLRSLLQLKVVDCVVIGFEFNVSDWCLVSSRKSEAMRDLALGPGAIFSRRASRQVS